MEPLSVILAIVAVALLIFSVIQLQRAGRAEDASGALKQDVESLREKVEGQRTEISELKRDLEKQREAAQQGRKKGQGEARRAEELSSQLAELTAERDKAMGRLAQREEAFAELQAERERLERELGAALEARPAAAPPPAAPEPAPAPTPSEAAPPEEVEAQRRKASEAERKASEAERKVADLERRLARMDEKLSRAEEGSRVANTRLRDVLHDVRKLDTERRRALRQEADHREMFRVLKERLTLAQDLLRDLELKHGVRVPDELGMPRRLPLEQVVEYADEGEGSRLAAGAPEQSDTPGGSLPEASNPEPASPESDVARGADAP